VQLYDSPIQGNINGKSDFVQLLLLEVKSVNHSIIRVVKSTNILSGHVDQMHGTRTIYRILQGKSGG
jgi:hypothetical protein